MSEKNDGNPKKLNFKDVLRKNRFDILKIITVGLSMFCVLFIYTTTRDLKDALILKAPGCDQSSISILKLFVLPIIMLCLLVYSWCNNKFGFKKTFIFLLNSFIVFYFITGFISNFIGTFHFTPQNIKDFQTTHNFFLGSIYALAGNWLFSLFYVSSEVFGVLVLSSVFWQIAFKTCKINELKKNFLFYSCIGNLGLIASSKCDKNMFSFQMLEIIIALILSLILFMVIDKYFCYKPKCETKEKALKKKNIKENFKFIFSSKYLMIITFVVFCYGLGMHVCEACWNEQLKVTYAYASQINEAKANCSFFTGIFAILITILASIFHKMLNFKRAALVTPILFLFFGGIFVLLLDFANQFGQNCEIFSFGISGILVFLGSLLEILSRSSKFALFETSKQMLYSPLNNNIRINARPAVEVVGSGSGKTLGFIITANLKAFFGSLTKCIHILIPLVTFIGFIWIISILKLDKLYKEKIKMREEKTKKTDILQKNKNEI